MAEIIILYRCRPFNASLTPMACLTQKTRSIGTLDYGKVSLGGQTFCRLNPALSVMGLRKKWLGSILKP